MVKKRKTLVENLQEVIDSGDLDAFKSIFDKCEINATGRGATTSNALSYKRLTPAHIQFLIDNGLDINSDCGYGYSAVSYQSENIENLKCLLENRADINLVLNSNNGSALSKAVSRGDLVAVKNLLDCGAHINVLCGWNKLSVLDFALVNCDNAYIPNTLEIARLLMEAGAEVTAQTRTYVTKIGERFEFYRKNFAQDLVDKCSDALDELYKLFDVEPVPIRVMYNGKTRIEVKATTWQKQHVELWNMLVPGNGAADTVQGEMIRIIGKILYELLDNGGMSWDKEYRNLVTALISYLQMENGLDARLCEEACSLARHITKSSDEKQLYRLNELVVRWVLATPQPIELETVKYKR